MARITRPQIFVFGSNLAGRHGAGSALVAKNKHGAKNGIGWGRTGNAYALPTKDENLLPLLPSVIARYVRVFLLYAENHPEIDFEIVKVGCGLAGYNESVMMPMFIGAPKNCNLPGDWRRQLENKRDWKNRTP